MRGPAVVQQVGLRLARDQGTCPIYHVSDGAYLGFCQRADATNEPGGVVVTLVTDGVDVIEIQRFWEPLV